MMELIPYVEVDGTRTISDQKLVECYEHLKSDRTLDIVFCNNEVNSPEEFIKLMKTPTNLPVFVVIGGEIRGLAWLNSIVRNYGFGHFALFSEIWGDTEKVGEKILEYWFSFPDGEGGKLFDVILGMVPSFNRRAINFVKRIGFTELTPNIPKIFPSGATILYRQR